MTYPFFLTAAIFSFALVPRYHVSWIPGVFFLSSRIKLEQLVGSWNSWLVRLRMSRCANIIAADLQKKYQGCVKASSDTVETHLRAIPISLPCASFRTRESDNVISLASMSNTTFPSVSRIFPESPVCVCVFFSFRQSKGGDSKIVEYVC